METQQMTAQQATTFKHGHSLASEITLVQAAQERGCQCEAYRDWFTYNRWRAQGFQVQKDEHGVKMSTWIEYETEETDGSVKTHSRPKTTTVFCRCQVKAIKKEG